ncbi:esterase/lipase family protein [Candidatus Oscillochloris fontis]|uniref:esterase/lipase family protein n=1 Tax=Candidatus Oscillochloris fontis TaxID=2496868 RepID=UPI0015828133|nr:alpha/beta fold hydrolase [Candidatus Oscillochloris fontis]
MRQPLVIIGGYLTGPSDFVNLAQALEAAPYNYDVSITPISRLRWAITRDWDFRPVINHLRDTVQQALERSGAEKVTILGHSVGGSVARMYLGEEAYCGEIYAGRRYVQRLIMLGTPHHSIEYWTRTSVSFINDTYPGAFYPEIHYTSVVGSAIQGNPKGNIVERMSSSSYRRVSGPQADYAWGDGVTTLECAALSGAEFLVVPELTHSPFHGQPWYGEPAGLPLWDRVL